MFWVDDEGEVQRKKGRTTSHPHLGGMWYNRNRERFPIISQDGKSHLYWTPERDGRTEISPPSLYIRIICNQTISGYNSLPDNRVYSFCFSLLYMCMCINGGGHQNGTYLTISGRRCWMRAILCLMWTEGANTTVQANRSSVDSSTGCCGVVSSVNCCPHTHTQRVNEREREREFV